MASEQEMPLFTRTFDFITWLLPVTNNFPRAHRHTATKRLLEAAFDLREHIEAAKKGYTTSKNYAVWSTTTQSSACLSIN